MGRYLLFILCFFIPRSSWSQLVVSTNGSAAVLAQTIVGNGITVSNATLNAGASSTGTFTYLGGNLGLPNGVLLTSGRADDVDGPGTNFNSVQNGNNLNDPDVVAISSQARFDNCLLEFDFIPVCDTLHITYVFGSEEYPRYIFQYNDVFAMFLTGPNPAGGNYSSQNIATLPNGITPVSIFTVNGGWPIGTGASNPAFYVDNYTNPNNDIAYDGYTIPITSVVAVTPCQTYHMKIAVVDAGNGRYDSGVFIQGNTFTCTSAPSSTIASTAACVNTGTATVVVNNFAGVPSYLWYPGGQTTASINNLSAGNYSCVITYPGLCTTDSLTTTIANAQPSVFSMSPTTICIGQSVALTASASGGTAGYTYAWSTNGTTVNANVSPAVSTIYTVTATDANGCTSTQQTVSITVNPPLSVQATNTITVCETGSASLSAVASGGNGNYGYVWSPAVGLSSTTIANPVATPLASGNYTVSVNDNCGTPTASAVVNVTVEPQPQPLIVASSTAGCAPLCVVLSDTSLTSCMSADWDFGDGSDTSTCTPVVHCFTKAGKYSITKTIMSLAGCVGSGERLNYIEVYPVPKAQFEYAPNPVLITGPDVTFFDRSAEASLWEWTFGDVIDDTSTMENPLHIYGDTGCYVVTLKITSDKGCIDSIAGELCVEMEYEFYAPNTFTPNGDGINEEFKPLGTGIDENNYELIIFDRWGQEIFSTKTWGEGWNGRVGTSSKLAQVGTYVWLVRVNDLQGNFHQEVGKVSLVD